MKTAVILGGSFDPPHHAHQEICKYVANLPGVSSVVVMPVGQHPFDKQMSAANHRLAMTKLAYKNFDSNVFVSDYEINLKGIGYSAGTLQHFAKQYPQYKWKWLIGSDNISSFNKWKNYRQILDEFGVIVYPRKDFPLLNLLKGMIALKNGPIEIFSSTEIRQQLNAGMLVSKNSLDPSVASYISKHKLYARKKI